MLQKTRGQTGGLLSWLDRHGSLSFGLDPGRYDPMAVLKTLQWVGRLFGDGHYFHLEVRGLEKVPDEPVLVVSNHSGGTTIPDVWGLLVGWYRFFGVERPLHPMAHELILATRITGTYFERRGVLQADRAVALRALRGFGRDVLCMPGGDIDTWRPFRDRFRVRFGGRLGYVRTALAAGAPIVPVAHVGAHHTFVVLTDGWCIAKRLHLPELARASIFPVHLSLPWGLAIGPWPHLPTPVRMRYQIGAPIWPPERRAPLADPPEDLVRAYDAKVREAIQRMLNALRERREEPRRS